jgi:hypothetical protein
MKKIVRWFFLGFATIVILYHCKNPFGSSQEYVVNCNTKSAITFPTGSEKLILNAATVTVKCSTPMADRRCTVTAKIQYSWASPYRDDDDERPENFTIWIAANGNPLKSFNPTGNKSDTTPYIWTMEVSGDAKDTKLPNAVQYSIIFMYSPSVSYPTLDDAIHLNKVEIEYAPSII